MYYHTTLAITQANMIPDWQDELLKSLATNPIEQNERELYELAILGMIPDFLIKAIFPEIRRAIARNPQTEKHLLTQFAHDEDEEVRIAIASNRNTSPDILAQLARDRNLDIRVAAVNNPQTSGDTLEWLSEDIYQRIRSAVIKHPNVTEIALEKLKEEFQLKSTVPHRTTQTYITQSSDLNIRRAVASYPETPASVLNSLAHVS